MIGIFDSGVGGLSVLDEIVKLLPASSITYFADTKNIPYGEKSEQFLKNRSLEISNFLKEQGANILVIACNTATAVAAEEIREKLSIPVVAVEPPIKPAASLSKTKTIGILATAVTIASQRYKNLITNFASGCKIIERSSNDLVSIVEKHRWETAESKRLLSNIVQEFLDQNVDLVVLGSTHFKYLKQSIVEFSSGQIEAISSAEATAKQVLRVAREKDVKIESSRSISVYVSGDKELFADNFANFCSADFAAPKFFGTKV